MIMNFISSAVIISSLACMAAGDLLKLSKRGGEANSSVRNAKCPSGESKLSCIVPGPGWPTKDFKCGQQTIHPNRMDKIKFGILSVTGDQNEAQPPQSMSPACQNKPVYKYSHGAMTIFYALETDCSCKTDSDLHCSNAVEKTEAACNLSKVVYCGVVVDGIPCPGTG